MQASSRESSTIQYVNKSKIIEQCRQLTVHGNTRITGRSSRRLPHHCLSAAAVTWSCQTERETNQNRQTRPMHACKHHCSVGHSHLHSSAFGTRTPKTHFWLWVWTARLLPTTEHIAKFHNVSYISVFRDSAPMSGAT